MYRSHPVNHMALTLSGQPEEWARQFKELREPRDVARLLQVDYDLLVYYLYKIPDNDRYRIFEIKKRSASSSPRKISAPARSLKIIQSKLAQVLTAVYVPKSTVHGFLQGRSILTNARLHANQKWLLNIDLKDFFPSINFGRVRGMFMATPYELDPRVATVLAQICCFQNQLPQGAPTSPIVSNMVCARLDSSLRLLAQEYRCTYSRYADDITFSTSAPKFPSQLAKLLTDDTSTYLQIGEKLHTLIQTNGFAVNSNKVRLQTRAQRQEVTGLVTNQFPNVKRRYVRQVRAMLHAWEKYGLENAEREHIETYRRQDRSPLKTSHLSFKSIILGKISFIGAIRGKTDQVYLNLLNKLVHLAPELAGQQDKVVAEFATRPPGVHVITEGPTDWRHLKAALRTLTESGQYTSLSITFHEYDQAMGHDPLLSTCKAYANVPPPGIQAYVFIFDRDTPKIVKEVSDGTKPKRWAPGVFSFPIPVPKHRLATPEISLEFYYRDNEIKREDPSRRRLFISTEFNQTSQRHNSMDIFCTDKSRFKKPVCVIDDQVFDSSNRNIALPKMDFACNVLARTPNFHDFDVSNFTLIFDELASISLTLR